MEGSYDLSQVALSYLVAILASYCALYFATQLSVVSGKRRYLWLSIGAMSMGLGIWSMHFIGMGAYKMAMPMTYDLGMTLVSSVAAVLSSGLALYLISRTNMSGRMLATGSLVMGAGIALMHYLGMAAMKMTPAVSYEPVWFSISIVIAVGASAAAMAICRYTQNLVGTQAAVYQGIAALVMGAAICGMHYSGMEAVVFPPGSMPDPANQLTGATLGVPVVVAAVVFVLIALVTVYTDIKVRLGEQERSVREEQRAASWADNKAFSDEVTGLPNRAGLEQHLAKRLADQASDSAPFAVLMLEMANLRELDQSIHQRDINQQIGALARALSAQLSTNSYLARYSNNRFCVITDQVPEGDVQALVNDIFQTADITRLADADIRWQVGCARFPDDAASNRELLRQALKTVSLKTEGGDDVQGHMVTS